MPAAAPKVSPKVAAAAAAAVGGSKPKRKPPTTAQRNARTSTKEHAKRQQQRVAAAASISANNVQIRQAEEERRRAASTRQQRNSQVTGAATGALKTPFQRHDTVSAPAITKPAINPLMLILFTWGGVIILYALITTPNDTNRFMATLRQWTGLIYSSKPMFKVATTTQSGS